MLLFILQAEAEAKAVEAALKAKAEVGAPFPPTFLPTARSWRASAWSLEHSAALHMRWLRVFPHTAPALRCYGVPWGVLAHSRRIGAAPVSHASKRCIPERLAGVGDTRRQKPQRRRRLRPWQRQRPRRQRRLGLRPRPRLRQRCALCPTCWVAAPTHAHSFSVLMRPSAVRAASVACRTPHPCGLLA